MTTKRVGWAALASVAVLVLSAACGDGDQQSGPTPTPSPSIATATPTPTVTATPTQAPVTSTVAVYFVKAEKMAPAQRSASGSGVGAAAVRALLAGPTAAEQQAGMSSAIPAGTQLRSLTISRGLAVVDLSGGFASGGGSFSMGARMAQLVTTLTQFPTVSQVRLWLDGTPATTLGGEGLIVDKPFGRADVEEWLPAILVDSPATGARITSPVRVRGSANVFEAVFVIEITDWDGRIVATRRVTASSGTGTRGTFDVKIPYEVDREGAGEVIVHSSSPKDGSRINVVETLVTVAP